MPHGIEVVIGHFTGRSLDAGGSDFTAMGTDQKLVARGHVFTMMVGHVVMQVISMRVEPHAQDKTIRIASSPGPWSSTLIQMWPKVYKKVDWPPAESFSTVNGLYHYGNFKFRWNGSRATAFGPRNRKAI